MPARQSSPDCLDPLAMVEHAAVAEELLSRPRHAARTKLATIRNAAFVIRQKLRSMDVLAQDARLDRFLGHIESEVDELTEILSEGNVSSSLYRPRTEPIALAGVIRRGVELRRCRRDDGVVVDDIPEALVCGDAEELALAVRCLVENAVDASLDGGKVIVRCHESEGAVVVEVEDAGEGLGAMDASHALRPFETTKPGHAGLGLSIARRIALRFGGGLTLETSPAGGIVARLELARFRPLPPTE